MKLPKLAVGLAVTTMLTLAACNGDNNPDNAADDGNGTRPIGYNQATDNPQMEREGNRDVAEERMQDDNGQTENKYDVSEEAAEKISADVEEVDRVYVLKTDNNAYVAASWNKQADNANQDKQELSDETKKKITDVVQSVDKDVDHVYISTNPDFFQLSGQYIDDMENGQPVEGFFKRMGNMIERVFPDRG
ncbi:MULTISPECIES: YhcN/YlaJ family sporulation lipoprotein [Gracilibacillus]|uniref:YhcN/YlaJ family sporulation lipoprotein n=1 Tax=Gracilibacillus TaxID=74385 RepID=UPI000825EEB6|nr:MULTISPECIES: YhcN/YlaJ family sporulation lipoprotein [Gracilibacillus]